MTDETSDLTADELAFLREHGGVSLNSRVLAKARTASAVDEASELNNALTIHQVADLLGVSDSRVHHRLSEGSLYAYKPQGHGAMVKLSRWQFHYGDVIPHLPEVLHALLDRYSPVDIRAFFLNVRVDHPTGEETLSVKDWLIGGEEDPTEAIELADSQKYTI